MNAPGQDQDPWLAGLRQRADSPPLVPRTALTIGDPPARIGSVEPSLAQCMQDAGLPLRRSGPGWHILTTPDTSLMAIAQWLNARGIGGRWRAEMLAVIDEQGRAVGAIERAAVRPLGLTTFAVHLVAARADAKVWVQQRAANKATDPGQWDTTMGGQVGAGESAADALTRETWEEAGLHLAQMQGLREAGRITFRRPVTEGFLVEHIDVFDATLADAVVPANQDGEVQRFDCLAPGELLAWLREDRFTLEAATILVAWLQRRGFL